MFLYKYRVDGILLPRVRFSQYFSFREPLVYYLFAVTVLQVTDVALLAGAVETRN